MIDLPPQSRWVLTKEGIKLYEVDYSREGEEPDLYLEPRNDVTARDGPKLLTGRKVTARAGSVWVLQASSGFYPYSVLLKGTGECEGDYWSTDVEKLEAWFRREGKPGPVAESPDDGTVLMRVHLDVRVNVEDILHGFDIPRSSVPDMLSSDIENAWADHQESFFELVGIDVLEPPTEKPEWPGKRTVKEGDTQLYEE